jgi:hypothetical protein
MTTKACILIVSDYGLEGYIDITAEEEKMQQSLVDKLATGKTDYKFPVNFKALEMRCRMNSQRNLQAWAIKLDSSITEEVIDAALQDNKQTTMTLIMQKGVKVA